MLSNLMRPVRTWHHQGRRLCVGTAPAHQITSVAIAIAVTSILLLAGCTGGSPSRKLISGLPQLAEPVSGKQIATVIEAGFVSRDPSYREHKAAFGLRLQALAGTLAAVQYTGNDMACSTQIYLEAQWLFHDTADWEQLDQKLLELSESLKNRDQAFALQQSAETHFWGVCYDRWFFRSEYSLAWLDNIREQGRAPAYALSMPERIDTSAKLKAYLDDLLVSDVQATGRDNRGELGSITTSLSSSIFKEYFQKYLRETIGLRAKDDLVGVPDSYAAVYEDFIERWQDPQNGYWGPWYRFNGRVYQAPDLSMTYHTIVYRRGHVAYWPQIIDTTLRIADEPYPYGWFSNGHLTNHNNYDVARILKFGWSHMSVSQRTLAAKAIHDMLDWTLNHSLNEDGSFKLDAGLLSSVAAEYYFGVSFLDQVGYWDHEKRFWTDDSFPTSISVCRMIRARLLALDLKDPQAVDSLQRLNEYCSV